MVGRSVAVAVLLSLAGVAGADAPPLIPLQGVLADADGHAVTTTVSVRFAFFASDSGGTELWSETQSVTPQDGLFVAYLGSAQELPLAVFRDNGTLWLEVKVGSDAPMTRVLLGTAPYGGFAEYCGHVPSHDHTGMVLGAQQCSGTDKVRGVDASGTVVCAADEQGDALMSLTCGSAGAVPRWNGTAWACTALDWADVNGKPAGLVLGAKQCSSTDKVRGLDSSGGLVCAADEDTVLTETDVDTMVSNNGYALALDLATVATTGRYADLLDVPTDLLSGTGSAGYLARFAATGVLGNSGLYQGAGGKIGIGTSSPAGTFEIAQSSPCWDCGLTFSLNGTRWKVLADIGGTAFTIAPNNDISKAIVDADGQVGIGTSTPNAKLDVAGTGTFAGGLQVRAYTADVSALGQGMHLQWNREVGGGKSYVLNERGLGPGGFVFGEIDGTTLTPEFRIESNSGRPNAYERTPNIIGGYSGNTVTSGVSAATIAGGGFNGFPNEVTDRGGTVGGGVSNQAGDAAGTIDDAMYATVGGGVSNTSSARSATIGGGDANAASGYASTISGGYVNAASGAYSTIGGGHGNAASGWASTVAGGEGSVAAGSASFAGGLRAKANSAGCFVWGDYTNADVTCDSPNRWVARASGGVYFYSNSGLTAGSYLAAGSGTWASVSDRNAKQDFAAVDPDEVLERVAALPISTWRYKTEESGARHMGPMAQDFHAAFGLGDSDKSIATVDLDGVTVAAIQGLNRKLDSENRALRGRVDSLEARLVRVERERRPGPATGYLGGLGLGGLVLGGLVLVRRRAREK